VDCIDDHTTTKVRVELHSYYILSFVYMRERKKKRRTTFSFNTSDAPAQVFDNYAPQKWTRITTYIIPIYQKISGLETIKCYQKIFRPSSAVVYISYHRSLHFVAAALAVAPRFVQRSFSCYVQCSLTLLVAFSLCDPASVQRRTMRACFFVILESLTVDAAGQSIP
jgi:hypothetical protein